MGGSGGKALSRACGDAVTQVGKKLVGEILGIALDVVDVGLDAYEYHTSIKVLATFSDPKGCRRFSSTPPTIVHQALICSVCSHACVHAGFLCCIREQRQHERAT